MMQDREVSGLVGELSSLPDDVLTFYRKQRDTQKARFEKPARYCDG
jgi:uncharacterized protein YihD (DUF1040 family)